MDYTIELIKSFFKEENWEYYYDEEKRIFRTEINMNGVLGSLRIYIFVQKSAYLVYAKIEAMAEQDSYINISEYLHRVNHGLFSGNFELDYEDGEIRYKIFVDFENVKLSKEVVKRSILVPVFMFDKYGRGLIKLMLNEGDPKKLIDEAEKDESSFD